MEETFGYLNKENPYFNGSDGELYTALWRLNYNSDMKSVEKLVNTINTLNYHSNTNAVFEFYLPIIAHTLYYKPEFGHKLLHLIIAPLFAMGIEEELAMIREIEDKANHHIKTNRDYLSREGKKWISKNLPNQVYTIKMQIADCKNGLE